MKRKTPRNKTKRDLKVDKDENKKKSVENKTKKNLE